MMFADDDEVGKFDFQDYDDSNGDDYRAQYQWFVVLLRAALQTLILFQSVFCIKVQIYLTLQQVICDNVYPQFVQ